jgi:rod shape-determining protein MreD
MSLIGLNNQRPSFIKSLPIYAVNLILLLLSGQVVDILALDNVHVIFFMAALFYWIVHRPTLMPLWFVFLGGLYIDFSVDSLLGFHAFGFTLYALFLHKTRRIILSQPIMYHFIIYALSVICFEGLRWGMLSLLTLSSVPLSQFFMAGVVNIILFLPLVLVLKSLHRIVSGYGRSIL